MTETIAFQRYYAKCQNPVTTNINLTALDCALREATGSHELYVAARRRIWGDTNTVAGPVEQIAAAYSVEIELAYADTDITDQVLANL